MLRLRPTALSPIATLDILGDSVFLIGGILVLMGIPAFANNMQHYGIDPSSFPIKLLGGPFGYAIGIGLLTLGTVNVGASIGLLKGKSWAWSMTVILAWISSIVDIVTINLRANTSSLVGGTIGCIIDAVILFYLYRPHVKAYFGKKLNNFW